MKRRLMVSYGSAVELGLIRGALSAKPTTMYFLSRNDRCNGRCVFCPQSNGRIDTRISRVEWPSFPFEEIQRRILPGGAFRRICLQCTDEESVREDLPNLVNELDRSGIPISVSTSPIGEELISVLKKVGTDILTIPIDCARESIFAAIKGRPMANYMRSLEKAIKVFGRGKVGTHLIVGLGETERDLISLMGKLFEMGVTPSLFAFTPVKGTAMEHLAQPDVLSYRRVQLARHLLASGIARSDKFEFNDETGIITKYLAPKEVLLRAIASGETFMTSGCPNCNRPYFNERVSGPIFNYPFTPKQSDFSRLCGDLVGLAEGY